MAEGERRLLAILFTDIVGYTSLLRADETRGIEAREEHRRLVRSLSAEFHGSFVDESGDASLSVFASAVDAVRCALAIQAVLAADSNFQVRAGIHVGDVVEREGRLIGDGINVASRLPALAEPGGVVATDRVVEHLRNQRIAAHALGAKKLKNVAEPIRVYTLSGSGRAGRGTLRRRVVRTGVAVSALVLVAIAWLSLGGGAEALLRAAVRSGYLHPSPVYEQQIAFARAADGTSIAWTSAGAGQPVVVVLPWNTHIERGYLSPGWNPFAPPLLKAHRVVHYDGRGFGLSDRDISDYSLEARLEDLETVVDAAGLKRFALYALSAGGPIVAAYAARHPERVTRIVFYGTLLATGCDPDFQERWRSFPQLIRARWGRDDPAFDKLIATLFDPDAARLHVAVLKELSTITSNAEDAARFIEATNETDVEALSTEIRAPTLVVHVRGDPVVPFACGRRLAALVPGARFVTLEGNHHSPRTNAHAEALAAVVVPFFGEDLRDGDSR